jgi:hypothetical protein
VAFFVHAQQLTAGSNPVLVSRIAERSLVGAASILTVPIVADSPCRGQIFQPHWRMEILTVLLNRAPFGAAPACLMMLVKTVPPVANSATARRQQHELVSELKPPLSTYCPAGTRAVFRLAEAGTTMDINMSNG